MLLCGNWSRKVKNKAKKVNTLEKPVIAMVYENFMLTYVNLVNLLTLAEKFNSSGVMGIKNKKVKEYEKVNKVNTDFCKPLP